MNENPHGTDETGIFDSYHDTQREILAIELRKTKNKLLTIALVLFIGDLLAIMLLNVMSFSVLLSIIIIPAVIAGLAFLALKEPLAAMIIATLIIGGIWIYIIVLTEGTGAFTGIIVKIIVIYLAIAGFQSAREAHRIKKEISA